MRARAQKKKKVAGGVEVESPLPRRPAVKPPAEVAPHRAVPDPQEPPVVAPVLMPAVGLEVAADELAVVAGAIAAGGLAKTPAAEPAEPDPSDATATEVSPPRQEDELPYGQQRVSQLAAAPPPREDRVADSNTAEDEPWRAPDEARLLVQSPRRLFLYWRFARDPRELLREALGPVAEQFGPAVRLVDATNGEEGEPAPAEGSDYWFNVLPGRLLRAEVGFHGEGLPFVRLISSNTVETPAVGVSPVEDEAPEFRVADPEFGRVLEATGFAAEAREAEPARRAQPASAAGEPDRPFSPDRFDEPARTGEPPHPRASSDTARPASSPRDGNHFSNTRGGEPF